MSTWKVTIRTDEGHKKWASVEAADVAGAIAASGAEAGSVHSVKDDDTQLERLTHAPCGQALGIAARSSA